MEGEDIVGCTSYTYQGIAALVDRKAKPLLVKYFKVPDEVLLQSIIDVIRYLSRPFLQLVIFSTLQFGHNIKAKVWGKECWTMLRKLVLTRD